MRRYPDDDEEELPTGTKAIEHLDDPTLWRIAGFSERWEQGKPLAREPEVPLFVRTEMKLQLDAEAWRIGFLQVRERELPGELYADMRQRAPQSLLRDLHRPVHDFYVTPELVEGSEWRLFEDAARLIREGGVHMPELPLVEPLTRAVREEQQRRRLMLEEQWLPGRPDDAPRDRFQFQSSVEGVDEDG